MLSPLMFIIGFVIFILYMSGLLWMIKSSHDDQRRRRERDERFRQSDENDYDGGGNWGRFNPHVDEKEDSYVKNLFKSKNKSTKSKKNVGKKMFWD